jgi:hypothetical protein
MVTHWFFRPFSQAERAAKAKRKPEGAQQEPARSRQGQGRPFREPSEPSAERGNPGFWGAEPGAMALVTFPERKVTRRTGAEPR